MHPRQQKLMLSWTRKPSLVYRAVVFSLTLSFGLPIPTARAAASKEQLLQVGSFMGLAGAIWRLNKAMRAMADSPLEKAKRDEVNAAMAAVPAAIQGLAGDFQSQKLGNSSLPIVLSMLGGFVDKNAADNYSKFLKNPSAGNIPKLGADFPAEAKSGAEADKLFYETVNREAAAAANDFTPVGTTPVIAEGQQVVNLQNFGSGTRGLSQSSGASSGLFYDRDAPVSTGKNDAKKTGSNGSRPSSLAETKADIAQIESGISGLTILNPVNRKKAEELEQSEMEASEMFKSVGKEEAKPKEKARKISKPVSFHGLPVFRLASLVIFGDDAQAQAGQQQIGQQGMQPESGSKAAEILFGMAAIIGAVVPIFVASSQAQSQQQAAQTQANAQIQMTQISAQTSIDLANMSARTAREQAMITQELAQKQLDAKKENLNINLNALAQQRQEVRDAEREQLATEKEFNQQRVALAQKQLEENIRVSQAALNAQIIQGGLATGLTTTQGDPNRLAVTSLQNGAVATANANATAATTANATAGNLGGALGGTATGLTGAQRLGLKSGQPKSSSTLMASALGTPVEEVEKAAGVKKKNGALGLKKGGKALGLTANVGNGGTTTVLGTARGAYAHGLAAVASGSFPTEKQVIPADDDAGSDLEKFRVASSEKGEGGSFSEWRTQRFEQAAQQGALHRDGAPAANRHGL